MAKDRKLNIHSSQCFCLCMQFNLLMNNNFRYEYELVVVRGLVLNDSVTPIIRRTAKEPPISLNPEDLGGEAAARHVFTMGVRLKSKEVSQLPLIDCRHSN